MASFAGISFSVVPGTANFFPGAGRDHAGTTTYSCRALFAGKSAKNAMFGKQSFDITFKRPRGSADTVAHVDAGFGHGTLVIPSHGGTSVTHSQAFLQSIDDAEGYGKHAVDQHEADLTFLIVNNPAV